MLKGKTYLITGIADEHSLAMYVAKKIKENGGQVICTGLGVSKFHEDLSDKAKSFLNQNFKDFQDSVHQELGKDTPTEILDVSVDDSIEDFCEQLKAKKIKVDGFLHAIAMDKTIRNKVVKPLLDVTFKEFCDTMEVSAFSLISLTSHLFKNNLLNADASICSISYIAASKVTFHPYRNISIAKAALERITVELADEMGRKNGTRVNCIRFSPYMGSKAGNATLNQKDVEHAHRKSPLGNALPEDLAHEVLHLLRPNGRITGEIRHVDGGYNIMG
ncbi:SDR family oxidoreductase [Psychroflexus sp. CAK57W]|uniref:SDR family oxidoreductase n=1 Tax=Psychroflexus curvus TaxID=2873595 RepID=UPI001CCBFF7A|nr:SDR family oxidoreductase [Psychroflexus curvus]MBZ9786504.1 SDR family oxidoreductase [Psychroflexus curvus]